MKDITTTCKEFVFDGRKVGSNTSEGWSDEESKSESLVIRRWVIQQVVDSSWMSWISTIRSDTVESLQPPENSYCRQAVDEFSTSIGTKPSTCWVVSWDEGLSTHMRQFDQKQYTEISVVCIYTGGWR